MQIEVNPFFEETRLKSRILSTVNLNKMHFLIEGDNRRETRKTSGNDFFTSIKGL